MEHVALLVGGIIPAADVAPLQAAGVAQVFTPGTPMREIIDFIHQHVARA
jgi:methylmalonyl-CoA mutase C-terminal domain/subunit